MCNDCISKVHRIEDLRRTLQSYMRDNTRLAKQVDALLDALVKANEKEQR